MDEERLFDAYNRYFEWVRADTPKLLEEVFRVRYAVYCLEQSFEDPADFPDGLERDGYDSHSVHSLLIHSPSGRVAGAVRLILPLRENPIGSLPIDKICSDPILTGAERISRASTAEVSRFAVTKGFRRRWHMGEQQSPSGVTEKSLEAAQARGVFPHDRRVSSHITLGLIASLVQMSAENGVSVWCSVMEWALLRLLTRIGIHFTPIGPQVEHHGKRQPCYSSLDTLLVRAKSERPDVWEILTNEGRAWPPVLT